ncbi:hypothetical protein ACFV0W_24350 [Streptomyces anulatus]|uniref:hypothetical protein n=1 Tax=Streptomyces anulatus TaxID=1892 RepID=UPI00367D8D41
MAKVLEFSVRTTTRQPLEEVRKSVESAFGFSFSEGEYEEVPAYVHTSLGMTIGLFQWGSDFLLETRIEDIRFLEAAEVKPLDVARISEPIADTLTIIGPFRWRIASDEDLAKDEKFAEELEKRMAAESDPRNWPTS